MVASDTNPYDIFSPQAQRNHALYAQMREQDPIHGAVHPVTGQTTWFLTRYDDCQRFLRDMRFGKLPMPTGDVMNGNMLNMSGDDHARLKALVHRAFLPSTLMSLRSRIQAIADHLLDAFDQDVAPGDDFNLTTQYIERLPLLTLMDLFGLPVADYAPIKGWVDDLLRADAQSTARTTPEFSAYLAVQIQARRLTPTHDLLTTLIFAENDGDALNETELLAMIFLLFTAGHETMLSFISHSVLSLRDYPEQMRLLVKHLGDTTITTTAIEELLRYNGPSYMTLPSWALEDVEMENQLIRQGQGVHAILDAANRDPDVFQNPDRLDILRQPNKHLAFSNGIHHCLGAPLARLGGDIAITTLLRRIPLR
jgi:cytochrome P450